MAASADSSRRFVLAEGSPLLGNLAALWAADAKLARRIEEALAGEGYAVEQSKSGLPTLALAKKVFDSSGKARTLPCPGVPGEGSEAVLNGAGGRIYLHSRYQPVEEARRLVESAGVEQAAIVCVHGFGLGYHVEAVFERAGAAAVVLVFEPDVKLLRTALERRDYSGMIRSGRVMLLTEADRTSVMLKLGGRQALAALGVGVVEHPPSVHLHREFHRAARVAVEEFLAYCRTSINTVVLNSRRTCENIARNLSWYVAAPGIEGLRSRHAGQPAIIVSAGPSLRKNKHLLKDARGRAVLIAVQTTLWPLLEMGVEPDYVTSLDYHEICAQFFERLPAGLRTELVAEPKAASAVLDLYRGPVRLLGNEFADKLVAELKLEKPRLRAGATVAHLAFYLAEHMGCDPVIFVGQDLGFGEGLCYMPGTSHEDVWRPELGRFCTVEMKQWEHIARERPILRRVEDWQGRPMYTEERLFTYLQQFERDFAVTRRKVIDATEGGARKRGAEAMSLAEAMARYCAGPLPRGLGPTGQYRWDLLPRCLESLGKRKDEARQIEQIARQTRAVLGELRLCLEDQVRSNRLIAQVDALHARMNALNDCYELVMLLGQRTELARFKSDWQIAAAKLSEIERQRRQLERDMVNVQGVIDAAGQFQRLMEEVRGRIGAWRAARPKDLLPHAGEALALPSPGVPGGSSEAGSRERAA